MNDAAAMATASPYATKITVNDGDSCNGFGRSTGTRGANLKDETLTKLTHMAWMRQPSESSIGNSSPGNLKSSKVSKEVDRTSESSLPRYRFAEENIPDNAFLREHCAANESSRILQTGPSGVMNRAISATPSAEKIPVRTIPLEEFDEYANERNYDSESLEGNALDRNVILERRKNLVKSISKRFFKNIKPACKNFEQFCFVDEHSLKRAFEKVFSHHRAPRKIQEQPSVPIAKSGAVNISSSLNAQASPFWPQTKNSAVKASDDVHDDAKVGSFGATPSSFPRNTKRGYILNRRPLSENSAQISGDSQHANRLDSQSQRQEYLRATLDELDALRLNNFAYFRGLDENVSSSIVEPYETDSIPDCKPPGSSSGTNLRIPAKSEYDSTLSISCESSACISTATSVTTPSLPTNSPCRSKAIVAPYSNLGKESNAIAENFELASGTTSGAVTKLASGATVVPNQVVCQSWPRFDQTGQFNRNDPESNDHLTSPLPRGNALVANAVSFRSDSNRCYSNFQVQSKLPGSLSAPPDSDVRGGAESVRYNTSCAVETGPTYAMRCDRTDDARVELTRPQPAVVTLVSNLPTSIATTATLSSPPQPVFATNLRTISSCNVSDQYTTSDYQLVRPVGAPTLDQKARISEQYASNASNWSHIVTVMPDQTRSSPPSRRQISDAASQLSTLQPTSLQQKASVVLPERDAFNQHYGDEMTDASVYRTSSPQPSCARVTAYKLSPVTSFFCADNNVLVSANSNADLYKQRAFVKTADVGTTAPQPSSRFSCNTSAMPSISDNFAPLNRGKFSEEDANEKCDGSQPVPPVSGLISHSSSSAQFPSNRMPQNSFASPPDQHPRGTNTVVSQCPASYSVVHSRPDTSTPIPISSQNSSVVKSGHDEMFVSADGKVYEKRRILGLDEKSNVRPHRSIIEAGQRQSTAVGVSQFRPYESYSSSGSNVAPSPSVSVVNQQPFAPHQSGNKLAANYGNCGVAMYSVPSARRGFQFSPGFSQSCSKDVDNIPAAGPLRTRADTQQGNNFSLRGKVTGVYQPSAPPYEP